MAEALLNFVCLQTNDIKAALDKSAPCKKSVDHRKYLQKQLKRFSPSGDGDVLNCKISVDSSSYGEFTSAEVSDSPDSMLEHKRCSASGDNQRHLNDDTVREGSNKIDSGEDDDKEEEEEEECRPTPSESAVDSHFEAALVETQSTETPEKSVGDEATCFPVPLRKRRLPASFWQEPKLSKITSLSPAVPTQAASSSVLVKHSISTILAGPSARNSGDSNAEKKLYLQHGSPPPLINEGGINAGEFAQNCPLPMASGSRPAAADINSPPTRRKLDEAGNNVGNINPGNGCCYLSFYQGTSCYPAPICSILSPHDVLYANEAKTLYSSSSQSLGEYGSSLCSAFLTATSQQNPGTLVPPHGVLPTFGPPALPRIIKPIPTKSITSFSHGHLPIPM